ncbi:MAG: acetate uptake transporter [Thermoplasmata archaeon]
MATPTVPGGDYYRPKVEESSTWANPAVVGLMGFGTTTMIAGIAIATNGSNWGTDNSPVFAMALAFGGSAQFVAGIIAMRKGEIFPGSAFMGYGAFWWAFTLFLSGMIPSVSPGAGAILGSWDIMWFMIVWALFTFAFAINSHKHGVGIAFVFWTLVLAYILLAIDFGTLTASLHGNGSFPPGWLWNTTGIDTFICGLAAWFVAMGILTSAHYGGKKVIPY